LFVIPQLRLVKCARLLSEQFTELRVFRLTEPACLQFNQIVVLARRRKRHSRLPDAALLDGVRCLEMLSAKSDLEPLGDVVDVRYEIPTSEPIVLTNMGIPLDEVEDLVLETSAYRQAGRVLLPKLVHGHHGYSCHLLLIGLQESELVATCQRNLALQVMLLRLLNILPPPRRTG